MADMDKFRPSKKVVLSALGIFAVVALSLGAGVGVRLLQDKNDTASSDVVYKGNPVSNEVEDIQRLRAGGNPDAAALKLNQALKKGDLSDAERYMLYIQQGNIASDKNDYPAAAASYEQAATIKQTYEIYMLLGDNWRYAKDNAKALEYYKKALPLIDSKNPMAASYKKSLEQLIASLEGGTPLQGSEE